MPIHIHCQATYHSPAGDCIAICRDGTPKVPGEIQASDEPAWVLAERYGTYRADGLEVAQARQPVDRHASLPPILG